MPTLSTIIRHEAQLRRATSMIREARGVIDEASNAANAAAEALVSNWEGAASDAFAKEQLNYKSWVQKMVGVIDEVVNCIDVANNAYSQVDEAVKNLIGNK